MKKKALLMTAVALVLLGAVAAAALNAVFTVTDVVVNFVPVSGTGVEESYEVQEMLDEKFVGKSSTFLDLEEVKASLAEYSAFVVKKVEKVFPRTVSVTLEERREAFAFERESGLYAVLDENGVYLYDKEENLNRRTGENILLENFGLSFTETGELAKSDCLEAAVSFAGVFMERLEDARANVVSISLLRTDNEIAGEYLLRVRMREGVVIDVFAPENFAREKAEKALEKYLSLSDAQRLYGFFDVVDRVDGGFSVSEHRAAAPNGV